MFFFGTSLISCMQSKNVNPNRALEPLPPIQLKIGAGEETPLGYYDPAPSFSWKIPANSTAEFQSAYQIQVASSIRAFNDKVDLWDSNKVINDSNAWINYQGKPLSSRQIVYWRVRYWDEKNQQSDWSPINTFELGLLNNTQWQGRWIRHPDTGETITFKKGTSKAFSNKLYRPQYLRTQFNGQGNVQKARLYVTAKGVFKPYLNGQAIGHDVMTPGWTPYKQRIETLTYDVTDKILTGNNVLGAILAEGWYTGRILSPQKRDVPAPYFLAQLEISYDNGQTQVITSNKNWRATHNGPIQMAGNYDGEFYDQSKEMPGWAAANFDDSTWNTVVTQTIDPKVELEPKRHAPVRNIKTLPAQEIVSQKDGAVIFDMGQNMVGVPNINIPVIKGQKVQLRFAEALEHDKFYVKNLRSAKVTDYYLPSQTGMIEYQPTFTFHGYRYVEISGHDTSKTPSSSWVEAVVQHSDFDVYANFESSHTKLNQLQRNITWGLRSNFYDIPLDCPQRDERLGWTGDAQVFAGPSMYMADVYSFWSAWLKTVREEQASNGRVPNFIPTKQNKHTKGASSGWGDVVTIVPWELYQLTGDKRILADNFEMMTKWLDYHASQSKGLISNMQSFADWLQPFPESEGRAGRRGDTDKSLISTAYYARSVEYTAKTAKVLGKMQLAQQLEQLHQQIKTAYRQTFYDENLVVIKGKSSQTSYLLPLDFGLFKPADITLARKHLLNEFKKSDEHLRTGFLGTPLLAPVLQEMGKSDLMYELLFKETYPSWFYSINNGATTTWERWNSYSLTEGFNSESMNSLNHYAYGAVAKWFYQGILGIKPLAPGFKQISIEPQFNTKLSSAKGHYPTPQGKVAVDWVIKDQKLTLNLTIPKNTQAELRLSDISGLLVKQNGHPISVDNTAKNIRLTPGQYKVTGHFKPL